LPASANALLRTIWSEWTDFEVWKLSSINHLRGTAENSIMSPTLAMALWAGLALLILCVLFQIRRNHSPVSYVLVVAIPWVILDLLWQNRLTTQLEETKNLFQGKTYHEKQLVDLDGNLYRYAQYLKAEVLPLVGARIFLLRDNKGQRHDYERLRLQYHLLPHNIYNYGAVPSRKHSRPGDYILVLQEIPQLEYLEQEKLLRWATGETLPVELINQHYLGSLYRVTDKAEK
jgi:hypothetical protein